jgi:hypothetical protein
VSEEKKPGWASRAYARAYAGQDYLATKLALLFGFGWTIWVFFIIPLAAPAFSPRIQAQIFYFASGWVQLFALPLMVYVSNKIQASADKTTEAQQQLLRDMDNALSQATVVGAGNRQLLENQAEVMDMANGLSTGNRELLEKNVELTRLVRELLEQNTALTREVRLAINGRAGPHGGRQAEGRARGRARGRGTPEDQGQDQGEAAPQGRRPGEEEGRQELV